MADDGERVPMTEVQRVAMSQVRTAPDTRWGFHRIQEGYTDGVPRAVFITPDDEPCGIPLIRNAAVIMDLAARLAREVERLTAERDALVKKLDEWQASSDRMRAAAQAERTARDALREKARAVVSVVGPFVNEDENDPVELLFDDLPQPMKEEWQGTLDAHREAIGSMREACDALRAEVDR